MNLKIGNYRENQCNQKLFLWKINKIDKHPSRIMRKRERWHKLLHLNEIDVIIIDPMNIKRIINEYHRQPYAYKVDKLDEMEEYPWKEQTTEITWREINNLNWLISIKSISNNLPKQEWRSFFFDMYQVFKEKNVTHSP